MKTTTIGIARTLVRGFEELWGDTAYEELNKLADTILDAAACAHDCEGEEQGDKIAERDGELLDDLADELEKLVAKMRPTR